MDQAGFRAAIGGASTFATDPSALHRLPVSPSGGAPAPFNALDPLRLSGPQGSHPLATVSLPELVPGPTSGLEGAVELDGPVRVGEAISGRIRIRARRTFKARSAVLRLVGMRLAEETRSVTEQPSAAERAAGSSARRGGPATTSAPNTISWVEVHASPVESLPFTDPVLPTSLESGQMIELPFTIPAPRMGPPTAHAGIAAIAWALEAHWDISMGIDERVCAYLDVRQHPDLLRAGVLTLPSGAMNDAVTDEDATISVDPLPPVPAGTDLAVAIAWPGAPGGRSARTELKLDVKGGTGLDLVVASVPLDKGALTMTTVNLPVGGDLPPTLEAPGLTVGYRHPGDRGPQAPLGRKPRAGHRHLLKPQRPPRAWWSGATSTGARRAQGRDPARVAADRPRSGLRSLDPAPDSECHTP